MDELKRTAFADCLNRIQETFRGPSGYSGDRVLLLREREQFHFESLFRIKGAYAIVTDAFIDFSAQTIEEAFKHSPQPSAFRFAFFIASLQRFRSSYNIFWDGYYFDAASHLRALFENLLNYGALINGFITEQELFEGPQIANFDGLTFKQKQKAVYKHQTDLAMKVRSLMIGSLSGLSLADQEHLDQIVRFLHSHVHRAESTQFKIVRDTINQQPISFLPILDEQSADYYIAISVMTCWAITRILPFLSQPGLHTDVWRERYKVLDTSFKERCTDQAILRFMNSKMNFGV